MTIENETYVGAKQVLKMSKLAQSHVLDLKYQIRVLQLEKCPIIISSTKVTAAGADFLSVHFGQ